MPRKSQHISHVLMLLGTAFALLLILASVYSSSKLANPAEKSPGPAATEKQNSEDIAGASTSEGAPAKAIIDTSNWKSYRDPVYHFEIKYPSEWPSPAAKKINDPDFDYEYQATFGTADTLKGNGIEGFGIFVFQTEKCATAKADGKLPENSPTCASQKTSIPIDSSSQEKILEFSSKVYTYTIVPLLPANNSDPEIIEKSALEFEEAAKTFSFDSSLTLPPPKPKPAASAPAPRPREPASRAGKITGAKKSGGKLVCPHPNRKPKKSPNKGNHVDEDCCPDPDEYPNSACAYKPSDYSIML